MTTIVVLGAGIGGVSRAFEKYFLRNVRQGRNEPFYQKQIMKWIGAEKLKKTG